jgi:tRNA nucleotidyltransferase (CCA-adding enzyme)
MELGYECIKILNGKSEKRYASHPYITGFIDGYEVDFVPCYSISMGDTIKSAVDRTILHMEYVKANLRPEKEGDVLLLKQFMGMVGTYGSEFKVGGFAGYLCELLILHYGSFTSVIEAAGRSWQPGLSIDLENYGTSHNFKDPLVVIDPVDPNRNVASSLSLQKMSEFVAAAGNFLSSKSMEYFFPRNLDISRDKILDEFNSRGTKTIIIEFNAPMIPADALHPQITKTEQSLAKILKREGFRLIGSSYYTDESDYAVILLEVESGELPRYKVHVGPSVWYREHGRSFRDLHPESWIQNDRWTAMVEREFRDLESLITHLLSEEGIRKVRGGKHVKKSLLDWFELKEVGDILPGADSEHLKFFYSYLHKGWMLER